MEHENQNRFTNESKISSNFRAWLGSSKVELTGADDTVSPTDLIPVISYRINEKTNLELKYTYRLLNDLTLVQYKLPVKPFNCHRFKV